MGPHQASLGHAHIRSHRADGHLPERTPCRASPTLASSPTAPAVSPFALRFGPVFASGPSPAPLTGRQLPSGYLGYEGILVHMATLGGTPTRWMCALRGARARTASSAPWTWCFTPTDLLARGAGAPRSETSLRARRTRRFVPAGLRPGCWWATEGIPVGLRPTRRRDVVCRRVVSDAICVKP